MDIMNFISSENLRTYLNDCNKVVEIDVDELHQLSLNVIKYFQKKDIDEAKIAPYLRLKEKWYESLSKNSPDYSVYSDVLYFCESWVCWKMYSRLTLKEMMKHKFADGITVSEKFEIKKIADLGCGTGLTTIALQHLFPKAKVIGTNFEDSYQFKIASDYANKFGFKMQGDIDTPVDLVFASEYFEHIHDSLHHLKKILEKCEPKCLVIANSFDTEAIGHFKEYFHQNKLVPASKMSRMFSDVLKDHGYVKLMPPCWNNRPHCWAKI